MATIKSYTDISQSKRLAEILPIESADMYYPYDLDSRKVLSIPIVKDDYCMPCIHCWSLAALLGVASTYCGRLEITLRADKNYNIFAVSGDFVFRSFDECSEGYNNPIDAAYELILKLNELNLL